MRRGLWSPLRAELRAFRADGLSLPVWWRDDDATGPTPQLDRLGRLADEIGLPVHLAVIPALAQPALAPLLYGGPFRGVVHGWSHANHAPSDRKRSEFGTARPGAAAEAAKALRHLRALAGTGIFPMFVPPWNRIHADLTGDLASLGYRSLSTFGPRAAPCAAPGLAAINTHVDPVDWRGTQGLADPASILDGLTRHLQARRTGQADRAEPLGLLTHHLMMDDPTWNFCHGLLTELLAGPAIPFDIATARETA